MQKTEKKIPGSDRDLGWRWKRRDYDAIDRMNRQTIWISRLAIALNLITLTMKILRLLR